MQGLVDRASHVLLQLEIPLERVQAAALRARANGAVVILDPAPAQHLPSSLIAAADFITPNESELRTLLHQSPSEQALTIAEAEAGARVP